jgi:polysaccharide pyruvyl transferase WcaK-like protein
MKYAKLGFNFYGSGNVGDDLMLDGFLVAWANRKPLFCVVAKDRIRTLQYRFPDVVWLPDGVSHPAYDLWIGVGDTPFQVLAGLWFLEYLEVELLTRCHAAVAAVFIGVGVEHEAIKFRERYSKIVARLDFITTRDKQSAEFLVRHLGADSDRVAVGDDLAHIACGRIFQERATDGARAIGTAINYYNETSSWLTSWRLANWLALRSRWQTVAFVANEARCFHGSEMFWLPLYLSVGRFRGALNKITVVAPCVYGGDMESVCQPYREIDALLSSRYHCLILGAWAGCRVVAISRSSKISTLADELGVTIVNPATCRKSLDRALASAIPLDMNFLQRKSTRSLEVVTSAISRVI